MKINKSLAKALSSIFSTKAGKLVFIVVLAGLMATSSAAVFTQYYANTTATVKTPDVTLMAGSDPTDAPSMCTVTVSEGTATVSINMYASAPTYYTNLLKIHNGGSGSHTISKITVSNVVDADSQLGSINVYYCDTSTLTPDTSNIGSLSITDTSGGTVFSGTQSIGAGADDFIEIIANAKTGATANKVVTFKITIEWV